MKHLLILISFLLLSSPLFGQSVRPETIIIPVSGIGEISNSRKLILQNKLTNKLKQYFRIVPQEKYEQVLEQVFEELEYEECSEDTCIMRVQEMLQVENVFHLQLIGEGNDIQLNLKWTTLEEKRNEEYFCEKCSTKDLYYKLEGLVDKLVGVNKIEVKVEKPVVVVEKTEKDKTKGLFVSVGNSGTILTSTDGTTWTKRISGTSESLYGVTYGNGLFVTVGIRGTILTSSDGTTWTKKSPPTFETLSGVTYGNGLFVIVSWDGTIITSSDGKSWGLRWKMRDGRKSNMLNGVTYGNNTFVVVGDMGTIVRSTDNGNSWSTKNTIHCCNIEDITYGNGLFVTVGDDGNIHTSSDGNSWSKRTSVNRYKLNRVTYRNGLFVTVGSKGTIITSSDGNSWNERTSGTSKYLLGVTYGNGTFVTVGGSTIFTSSDGTTWTSRTSGTSNQLIGITYSQ
jgi:photosystem II stability/assembly factor-like uncharacterized protein